MPELHDQQSLETRPKEVETKTNYTPWTENMLKALITNNESRIKWHTLNDKIWSTKTLTQSWLNVKSNQGAPGSDRLSIESYDEGIERRIKYLSERLREDTYQPQAIRRILIPKTGGGQRPLGIPTVEDRIVQGAVKLVIEPIFESLFHRRSYGFRAELGAKDGLRRVEELIRSGYHYAVDVDIKGYFDNIDHNMLLGMVEQRISDTKLLKLIKQLLKQNIRDGDNEIKVEKGTPQGGVLSPLLSNIYLTPLDNHLSSRGYEHARYADDIVILCKTAEEAKQALTEVQNWMKRAKLELHPEKTKLVDLNNSETLQFLGYEFKLVTRKNGTLRIIKTPRASSLKKHRDKIRILTRRCNKDSLEEIILKCNQCRRGWYEYYKHVHKSVLKAEDGWIRRRLRSLLTKRIKKQGNGLGLANFRWTDIFFELKGLFSFSKQHQLTLQALRAH